MAHTDDPVPPADNQPTDKQREQTEPNRAGVPDDPRRRPAETVEALETAADLVPDRDDDQELADDSPPNPDDDGMTGLPGPAGGEAGEPSG